MFEKQGFFFKCKIAVSTLSIRCFIRVILISSSEDKELGDMGYSNKVATKTRSTILIQLRSHIRLTNQGNKCNNKSTQIRK